MSDITTDTTRFTNSTGFAGASTNDLIRIAAQAIDYAGETSLDHSHTRCDDQGTVRAKPHEALANVVKAIREESDCIYPQGAMSFEFQYDGKTFTIYVEDLYQQLVADAVDGMVEEAQYSFDQMQKDESYLSAYIKFDEDMFRRDLQYDEEALVSPYDGTVHEMYWNHYNSGDDRSMTTQRETLYMIRED